MSLYSSARNFKLPESKARCTYCSTEYNCVDGPYSICPFCESMVMPKEKTNIAVAVLSKLGGITASIAKGSFLEAAENAETLATNPDPQVLYTLASMFKVLSDITYLDVDYTMKAFMERNADNRNDETKRNKYNAMHLRSRSRECFHKCIETMELSGASDERSVFTKAMAEIKLKRYAHASIILDKHLETSLAFKYAKTVLATETKDRHADKKLMSLLRENNINAIFYTAKYLAMRKDFVRAARLIDIISSFISLPRCNIYKKKIINVAQAAGI